MGKIGCDNKFGFGKSPEEGLVEHLVIGYFNGWVEYESETLQKFFEKASAKLRTKAARFMTTGFESTKEDDDEKYRQGVAQRMRKYWNSRIDAIQNEPKKGLDEAIELTGWVCDSLLPAKETLELLEKTLDLSGGKVGKMRGAKDFVEGVTTLGRGNELLALQCLKKASNEEEMHTPWESIQGPLKEFLERIVDVQPEIRSAAIEVADAYGRYNPDEFREVWAKLKGV